jgi:proteasome lid subunit RPN8/RPN11
MSAPRLADVRNVRIESHVVSSTLGALQRCGRRGFEGLVLWLGEIEGEAAHISKAIMPTQKPIRNESGVGYFVDGETLFRLNQALAESGLRLIAQVHSHPTEAYHSDADDRYAIVTAEGGLSFVVPNFGRAPLDPTIWAIYRLTQGEWRELNIIEAKLLVSMSVQE